MELGLGELARQMPATPAPSRSPTQNQSNFNVYYSFNIPNAVKRPSHTDRPSIMAVLALSTLDPLRQNQVRQSEVGIGDGELHGAPHAVAEDLCLIDPILEGHAIVEKACFILTGSHLCA